MNTKRKPKVDTKKVLADYFNHLHDLAYEEYLSTVLTEAESKQILFNNMVNFQTIKEERKCSVSYCRQTAVMSHLFQESILKKIATDGHLLSPSVDIKANKIELKKIGIRNAFTFRGFCEKHEKIFTYEKNEQINYDVELRMLIYKCACFNHVFWDVAYKRMKKSFDEVYKKRQAKFNELAFAKYQKLFKDIGVNMEKMEFLDHLQISVKKKLISKQRIVSAANNFKKLIWQDIKNAKTENLKFLAFNLTECIPICLSYIGRLKIERENLYFNNDVCLIIHPLESSTLIILSSTAANFFSLNKIFKGCSGDEFLSLIFTSLVYVSDNWLINPDFYKNVYPSELKNLIENASTLPLFK